jgi:hypothetical protein
MPGSLGTLSRWSEALERFGAAVRLFSRSLQRQAGGSSS